MTLRQFIHPKVQNSTITTLPRSASHSSGGLLSQVSDLIGCATGPAGSANCGLLVAVACGCVGATAGSAVGVVFVGAVAGSRVAAATTRVGALVVPGSLADALCSGARAERITALQALNNKGARDIKVLRFIYIKRSFETFRKYFVSTAA
jgi:hypothetical protein